MEFGLSTYLYIHERLSSHILDRILGAGFRNIEIFAARQHLDYYDPNHVRDIAQWFSEHGLTLHSLHAPLFTGFDMGASGGLAISVAHLEKRLRIDSMEEIKRAIDVSERLPFRYLVLHLGLDDDPYDLEKVDAAFSSIEYLKLYTKKGGAQILLENIPSELSAPERLVQFIQYTRLEDLKVCFDTGHAHIEGGVQPAFETLKERILSTHVHDNRHGKDDHLMPFEGEIDWLQTVRDFRSLDGQFPVLFEVRNYGPEVNHLVWLRRVIEKMEVIR